MTPAPFCPFSPIPSVEADDDELRAYAGMKIEGWRTMMPHRREVWSAVLAGMEPALVEGLRRLQATPRSDAFWEDTNHSATERKLMEFRYRFAADDPVRLWLEAYFGSDSLAPWLALYDRGLLDLDGLMAGAENGLGDEREFATAVRQRGITDLVRLRLAVWAEGTASGEWARSRLAALRESAFET